MSTSQICMKTKRVKYRTFRFELYFVNESEGFGVGYINI